MDRATRLLAAYDEQLRTDAETPGAVSVTRHGPLRLVVFPGGRGFVTYQDLDGADADGIRELVRVAFARYRDDASIRRVEWKSRGHDHAPGLHDALLAQGFVPEEPESIMLGEASALAVPVDLPAGVTLRRVTDEPGVRAMVAMQAEVFGDDDGGDEMAGALLDRMSRDGDGEEMELWVAEADGVVVSAGRMEPIRDSDVAGIWGGATRPEWRGRGIYRALTAERARAALARGRTLIHSDSTEYSRPILERAGLLRVSSTTPYVWKR